jgi:hypothetical protein
MARKKDYDVFLSYARVDDDYRLVRGLAEEMKEVFRRRTGHRLRIFLDRAEVQTSETWQPRIEAALQSSTLLVPVISKAYFGSDWCRREWNYFAAAERGLAGGKGLGLIYPVLLDGIPKVYKAEVVRSWLDDVAARQAVDLGSAVPGSHRHDAQVQLLMDGIMAKLHQVNAQQPVTALASDIEHLDVYTGYVGEGDRFAELLAEAFSVTIVGLTNETLADTLRKALDRKRQSSGNPNAFWRSLRIVFLGDQLLDSLNDVLTDFPDRAEDILKRRLAAGYGLRNIRILLEQVSSSQWELYESRYQLPFVGTLFEMPDGRRTVQLLLRRPRRRTPNQMYLELAVKPDQYLSGAFEDIVQMSIPLRYIVPIGVPQENGVFHCTGTRFRERVLRDGSHEGGWLPVVLLVTWGSHYGHPELWLQLRTRENSHREIGRLAHLTNYVFQDDIIAAGETVSEDRTEYDLSQAVLTEAARRCVRMEIGEDPSAGVTAEGFHGYLYPDKENLFFYLFTTELQSHPAFLQQAEMRFVSVQSLLAIREKQALRSAMHVCKLARRSRTAHEAAAEIASLNLSLHGHPDLAEDVLVSVRQGTRLDGASRRIAALSEGTRQIRQTDGQLIDVLGLAGLQYREFFTTFLPLYEKLGLPGATEALAQVHGDPGKHRALERLGNMYRDEVVMSAMANLEI